MNSKHVAVPIVAAACLLLAGCSAAAPVAPTRTSPAATLPAVTATATWAAAAYPAPDLAKRPLVWFGPLPPLKVHEKRPFTGSLDFMQLFQPDAQWPKAAGRVQVFKLFGEWVSESATGGELKQVFDDLRRRGIAVDVDEGPLTATTECGQAVEGFAGIREGQHIAQRVKAAGGTIDLIDMDEPFVDASLYDGPNACHWSTEVVAERVYSYVQAMHLEFPNAIIGTSEPYWKGMKPQDLENYIEAYRRASGAYFPFFHLDLDYSIPNWPQVARELEDYCRARGIAFGIYYVGNWSDASDEAWLSTAGERVKTYELQYGGRPDHVIFQSWNDRPDYSLPETTPYTFTNFVNAYMEDKPGLGVRTSGLGANLAFGKKVTASRFGTGFEPGLAVDGNTETWWGAAAPPQQWVMLDLGAPMTVAEIRLVASQSPAGETLHRLFVKGSGTGNELILVQEFAGTTSDAQLLVYKPPQPMEGIQYIRVETLKSPSWVAWREIQVIGG
jgi:hypothetical protein